MGRPISKLNQRALASIVALVLLLTALPLTGGVIIVSGPSHPEFTVNICQPIQAFEGVSNTLLARPATNLPQFRKLFTGRLAPNLVTPVLECTIAPETPPPKPLV